MDRYDPHHGNAERGTEDAEMGSIGEASPVPVDVRSHH
jgi:hypothetical protein